MRPGFPETAQLRPRADLIFDRLTGVLAGSTARDTLLVGALRAGARISSAWSYRGFAAGCRLLRSVAPPGRMIQVRLNDDAMFSFPFADGYWSLLLDPRYGYERDINLFFRSIADADYTLVDCGANFGYWSTLVTSAPYGAHPSVAIEPSSRNFAILSANGRLNGSRFPALHCAIGAEAGTASLSGNKHEAMTIAGGAPGGETVEVIALDSLLGARLDPSRRHVIKLDVEGVETEALRGGTRLLDTDCVVICEEHGNDRNHTISRYILANTGLKLFCYDPASRRFEHLQTVSSLDRIKTSTNWGYNILATRSPFWEARIRAIDPDRTLDSNGRPYV